jgi:predicted GNAT family acetyltransferase
MQVKHNEAQNRYELATEQGLAVAEYRQDGESRIFVHTEVPPAGQGKGHATRLVHAALEDSRKAGFEIVPACSFVAAFVRRHPQYSKLTAR